MPRIAHSRSIRYVAAALLFAATGAEARPLAGCDLLLLKNKELEAYVAETPEERREALDRFFEAVREFEPDPAFDESSADLSAAWWRIAFARRGGPIPIPAQMKMEELNALARSKNAPLYMRSLKTAHQISEFRIRTSLFFTRAGAAIENAFRGAGRWVTDAGSKLVPGALRREAEALFAKTEKLKAVRKTADALRAVGRGARATGRFVRKLPKYFEVAPRVSNAGRARTITLYGALKLRSALLAGIDFLSPLHLRTFLPERWLERTAPVFAKLEKDRFYVPNPEDLAILRKYGAETKFYERQQLLQENPRWFRGLRIVDATYRWTVAGLTASAIGLAISQSAWGDPPIDIDQLLNDPRYKLLPNQIQLINESVPFPHLAIRIGDMVYSYGFTHMTAQSLETYLRSHQPNGDGSGTFFERQRSMQIVTLNLAPDEIAKMRAHFEGQDGKAYDLAAIEKDMDPEYVKLRRYLLLQSNKEYKNVTFVNDCASMVARALRKETGIAIPKMIDASPSSIMMYFGMEKQAGNPKVESIRLVKGSKDQNATLQLIRNAYINAREARFFFQPTVFAFNQTYRAVIDGTSKPKDLQRFDEGFVAGEIARHDRIEKQVREDPDLNYYFVNRAKLAVDPDLRKEAEDYFTEIYSSELKRVESNYQELDQILGALYKLEFYGEAEQSLLNRRSFDLAKSLDDPEFHAEIDDLLESVRRRPAGN